MSNASVRSLKKSDITVRSDIFAPRLGSPQIRNPSTKKFHSGCDKLILASGWLWKFSWWRTYIIGMNVKIDLTRQTITMTVLDVDEVPYRFHYTAFQNYCPAQLSHTPKCCRPTFLLSRCLQLQALRRLFLVLHLTNYQHPYMQNLHQFQRVSLKMRCA